MKLIHCADLHLDSRMTSNLDGDSARIRRAELLNTFIEMVDFAAQNEVEAIIIAGDLTDTQNVTTTTKNAIIAVIKDNPHILFYYLSGNHDEDSFLFNLDKTPKNLKLFSGSWSYYVQNPNEEGNIVIAGLELNDSNYRTYTDTLTLDDDNINIVVLHGQEKSSNNPEGPDDICIKRLMHKSIDYLALGHVHTYKKEQLDGRGVYCYSGCLEGRGFDEFGEHGFVLIDIDERTKSVSSDFVSFAKRELYEVRVDITDCMTSAEIGKLIDQRLSDLGYSKKCLIKVVLYGRVDVECEINSEFLSQQLRNSYFYVKVCNESKLKVDYSSYAKDESLKGEFVRQVISSIDLSEDEKAEIIKYGIMALAGEELE